MSPGSYCWTVCAEDLRTLFTEAKLPHKIGQYDILGELGRGGTGVVYLAHHPKLDQWVALKVLRRNAPVNIGRLQAEGRAMARFQHPNVVGVHEVGSSSGRWYLAMELVEGESLKTLLHQDGALPSQEAARIAERLACALEAAHLRGILHRDLKPGNVLLTPEGEPRLVDFGLAKDMRNTKLSLTRTGEIVGTPSYMPPEQARCQKLDARGDVYGLGATLYAMLTGRPPFKGHGLLGTLPSVLRKPPQPPRELNPEVDPELEAICLRCLEKDPQDRYPSAQALADDLRRYLDRPQPPQPRRRQPRWRRVGMLTLALTAAGALLAACA